MIFAQYEEILLYTFLISLYKPFLSLLSLYSFDQWTFIVLFCTCFCTAERSCGNILSISKNIYGNPGSSRWWNNQPTRPYCNINKVDSDRILGSLDKIQKTYCKRYTSHINGKYSIEKLTQENAKSEFERKLMLQSKPEDSRI